MKTIPNFFLNSVNFATDGFKFITLTTPINVDHETEIWWQVTSLHDQEHLKERQFHSLSQEYSNIPQQHMYQSYFQNTMKLPCNY